MNRTALPILIILTLPLAAFGCSGAIQDGISAPNPGQAVSPAAHTAEPAHILWGYYQFRADPDASSLEFIPLRGAGMHLNAIKFLEPPPNLFLTLESPPIFSGNILDVDIGLRNPYLGLNQFTGFDVCGVFITSGTLTGFDDPDIVMAGDGDTRLLNPDGYTRWWNPAEFPINLGTVFSYNDGLLGTPDSVADYNSTLNAYKYFCDDLPDPDSPLGELDPTCRGVFRAGQKNVRHYTIKFAAGLIFNYAVDASWQFPSGPQPWSVPDDFGPGANRPEAWHISVTEIENTLWNDGVDCGGDLVLEIDAYDWFNADLNTVKIESGLNFPATEVTTPTGGGEGYSTYEIEIIGATPVTAGIIDVFITVTCEATGFGGLLPGKPQSAYAFHPVEVDDESPVPPTSEWPMFQHDARNSGLTDVTGPQTNHIEYTKLHKYGNAVTVLTGPGDGIYCTFFGSIYDTRPLQAVDRFDGSLLWMQDFSGPDSSYVRALCVDPVHGWIYAFYSGDGTIHKLDPADGSSAITPASGFSIGANQFGILHDNGKIYVTSQSNVKCLDSNLNVIWSEPVGFTQNGSPAMGIDKSIIVYADQTVKSLDKDDGTVQWSYPVAHAQATPTVLSDGTIIMPTNGGNVYAITAGGALKWVKTPLSGYSCGITSAAEGPNGDVYLVVVTGPDSWLEQLVRLDPVDGTLIDASGSAYDMTALSIPAIDKDGTIYVDGTYRIFAFNPDCTLIWQSDVVGSGMAGKALGPCAIDSHGDLYAASGESGFICIRDQ